ncbi:HD-GYP domain-containing protein [Komagataeibacter sp. FNDCR2]|uniref:HD-GYP domain-containing protein n=1 Tax=Komagataeibacter sp. FNDCR2 TaxID=2878682 RepID=UPI001E2F96C0|nr:HD domain-containing phosphohydrolase [Komagataeibacter sp. FNDCR2]MCE2576735.1 HD domain-containing protein [Komagataeibacter sp. FNDCR2]
MERYSHDTHEAYVGGSPTYAYAKLRGLALVAGRELEGHGDRVAAIAPIVFDAAGLPGRFRDLLLTGARIHDIGKRLIPPAILYAPRRLTVAEWAIMTRHPELGIAVMREHVTYIPRIIRDCVLLHHERWDGTGYPRGLSGPAIPVMARIVAIADFIDALASQRSYKPPVPMEVVRSILLRERGRMFDPYLTDRALRHYDRIVAAWLGMMAAVPVPVPGPGMEVPHV